MDGQSEMTRLSNQNEKECNCGSHKLAPLYHGPTCPKATAIQRKQSGISSSEIAESAAREIESDCIEFDEVKQEIAFEHSRASAIILRAIEESQGQQEPQRAKSGQRLKKGDWVNMAGFIGEVRGKEAVVTVDGNHFIVSLSSLWSPDSGAAQARMDEDGGADTRELREALVNTVPFLFEYGHHHNDLCYKYPDAPDYGCFCGLDEVKKRVERVLAQGEPR